MINNEYTYEDGVYRFTAKNVVLVLKNVQLDRYGRVWADARIATADGDAILAIDHGDLTSGRFRTELASQAAKRNSLNPIRYENLVTEAVIALEADPDLSPGTTMPDLIPAPKFVRTVPPPSPTVVDGLLERGRVYSLVSKPKTGKSLAALDLAISITEERTWLGRQVIRGTVVCFQLEDSERTIKHRLERIASRPLTEDLLLHARSPFRLTEDNYAATVAACQGCAVVIADPIIQASEVKDWNAQGEVRDAYVGVGWLGRRTRWCSSRPIIGKWPVTMAIR